VAIKWIFVAVIAALHVLAALLGVWLRRRRRRRLLARKAAAARTAAVAPAQAGRRP
jgi:hypothetical protein